MIESSLIKRLLLLRAPTCGRSAGCKAFIKTKPNHHTSIHAKRIIAISAASASTKDCLNLLFFGLLSPREARCDFLQIEASVATRF